MSLLESVQPDTLSPKFPPKWCTGESTSRPFLKLKRFRFVCHVTIQFSHGILHTTTTIQTRLQGYTQNEQTEPCNSQNCHWMVWLYVSSRRERNYFENWLFWKLMQNSNWNNMMLVYVGPNWCGIINVKFLKLKIPKSLLSKPVGKGTYNVLKPSAIENRLRDLKTFQAIGITNCFTGIWIISSLA